MIKSFVRSLFPKRLWLKFSRAKVFLFVFVARIAHVVILSRIRRKILCGEKIRVAFVDSEIAKWKSQSLYDLMVKDAHYEPFILAARRDLDKDASSAKKAVGAINAVRYFEEHGNICFNGYDPSAVDEFALRRYKPDIVFYQQAWYIPQGFVVSAFALPCYIPYYVANYGSLALDAQKDLHRLAAYTFLQSEDWVHALTDWAPRGYYSGRQIPVGHTMLDYAYLHPAKPPKSFCVLYAPHFSFSTEKVKNILNISTFPWSGRAVLAYAKAHPEIAWIFKPHPLLRQMLIKTGLMASEEVDAYYAEWAALGRKCEDSNYWRLFDDASVMITDCGSFLTEFGSTGKPIIHLISNRAKIHPMKPSQELYSTYYQVHNLEEMYATFETVLESREDPKRKERQAAVEKAKLSGNYAAKNIMDFFDKEFGIKR